MRILNFGSLNIDMVYAVDHLVQPGETLSSDRMDICCGGKGLNQSIALSRAGMKVYHAGKVGKDGDILIDTLKKNGVDVTLIDKSSDLSTGHAIIQVDLWGQNSIILFAGANGQVGTKEIDHVLAQFKEGDWIILQNEISGLREIIEKAGEKKMFVVLNPSPANERLKECDMSRVSMFVLNEIEGSWLSQETEPEKILDELLRQYPNSRIILTLGDKGAYYADQSGKIFCEANSCEVVDTTAAGDTFTGYFVCAMMEGKKVEDALRIATIAASIAIGRKGASPSIPMRAEVDRQAGT